MCETNGIVFRLSCTYTSSHNGKFGQKICSIKYIIRILLIHMSLPTSFWHHALKMATYLLNVLPRKSINFESPLIMLYHKDPSYSHLCVFGCLYFPLFRSSKIHKLQPRSTKCVFLGYPSNHQNYKFLDLSSNKTIIYLHVMFDKSIFHMQNYISPNPTHTIS